MEKKGVIGKLKEALAARLRRNGTLNRLDAGCLKVMLMVAAVDGELSEAELDMFRSATEKACDGTGKTFSEVWDAAVRSAGYLLLQARILSNEEIVEKFVAEAERDFVGEVSLETNESRERVFRELEEMANADGEYSEVESKCLMALFLRVKAVREEVIAARYPRAFCPSGKKGKVSDGAVFRE